MLNSIDKKESPYYIFVSGGDRIYLLGKDGKYLEENIAREAMSFNDIIDAVTYIEKKGLQRLATIRRVKQSYTGAYLSQPA